MLTAELCSFHLAQVQIDHTEGCKAIEAFNGRIKHASNGRAKTIQNLLHSCYTPAENQAILFFALKCNLLSI